MSHSITFIPRSGRAARRGVLEWQRMTSDALKDCNKRHLAQMAKQKGNSEWHAMRKEQLLRALSLPRKAQSKSGKGRRLQAAIATRRKKPAPVTRARPSRRAAQGGSSAARVSAAIQTLDHACQKDRIIVLTRD